LKTYKYQAISKDGAKVSGVVEGFNEFDAVDKIKEKCDIVIKLTEVKEEKEGVSGLLAMEIGGNNLDMKQFTIVCSQFSILIKSGLSIVRTTELVATQTKDEKLKKILTEIQKDVAAGRSLATSFEERGGKMMPVLFIETIRAGEESGNLDVAFDSMYKYFDRQADSKSKVKSAMIYPIFVLVVAVVVVIVLMVKVVPTFSSIFDSYGSDLPTITKILIAVSNFFQKSWIIVIAALIAIIIGVKVYGMTENGKTNLAKLSLKLPALGNIQKMNAACQFSTNFGTLLKAGITILDALPITSKVIENYYISKEVGKLNASIEQGRTLGDSMKEMQVMPDMLNDMVAVGEETGHLEETLDVISYYYQKELDTAIKDAINKLEPTLLLVVAGIAGFIVIAVYLAMFEMYGVM